MNELFKLFHKYSDSFFKFTPVCILINFLLYTVIFVQNKQIEPKLKDIDRYLFNYDGFYNFFASLKPHALLFDHHYYLAFLDIKILAISSILAAVTHYTYKEISGLIAFFIFNPKSFNTYLEQIYAKSKSKTSNNPANDASLAEAIYNRLRHKLFAWVILIILLELILTLIAGGLLSLDLLDATDYFIIFTLICTFILIEFFRWVYFYKSYLPTYIFIKTLLRDQF